MSDNVELEVRSLTKRYSAAVTIGPISFDVREGEFLSLLGPSGCGKTTSLRCIAGFESLSDGTIFLNGERLDDKPPYRRDVGLVFQNYALFPHLSVFDNIAFGLKLRKVAKSQITQRVGRMLELVGLPELADRLPSQLSGGQQQRIAIARSLVLEPRLLLFDEPLSNLDFKLRVQMRSELRNLQQKLGKTSIYVTHDQTEALALSDRIAVLSHGRIEQIGTPVEVYEAPKTAFVAEFIGNSNIFSAKVEETKSDEAAVRTTKGSRLIIGPSEKTIGEQVRLVVRPERIRVIRGDGPPGGAINVCPVEIGDVTYLGEDIQLQATMSSGEVLHVALKSDQQTRNLSRGAAIDIAIDPADIHVLEG